MKGFIQTGILVFFYISYENMLYMNVRIRLLRNKMAVHLQ